MPLKTLAFWALTWTRRVSFLRLYLISLLLQGAMANRNEGHLEKLQDRLIAIEFKVY